MKGEFFSMNLKKIISAVTAFALSATMLVGFSANVNAAEGDVTTNATADFSAAISNSKTGDFTITSNKDACPLEIDANGWLLVGQGEGTVEIPDAQLVTGGDKVTIKFKVAYAKLTKKFFYYNIKDSKGTTIVSWKYDVYNNSISENILGIGTDLPSADEFYHGFNTPLTARAADLTFEIDFASGTVKQTTLNMYNNKSTTHTGAIPSGVSDVKKLTIGSDYNNTARRCAVDDISIATTEGAAITKADYNIKYVIPAEGEGDATVIKTVPLNGVVGTAPVVDTDDFVVDGQRYICDSNDASGKTIASDGSMVVTVNCHAAANYEMKVETSTGTEIKTENVVEHDSLTYSFSKYLTDANGKVTHTADNTTYSVTTTPTASDTITVPYTEYTGTAYFVEAEKVLSTTVDTQTTYSGGKARRSISTESDMITVAEDGIYTVAVAACSYNTNKGCTLLVNSKREGESNQIAEHSLDISWKYITEMTTENVALKEGDVITLVGGATNGTNAIVDYVLLTKTAELPVVTTGVASTVEGTSFPTLTGSEVFTNAADADDTATYSDLTTGKTVKTVYAKVKNSANAPVIKIGDAVQTSKWTAVGTTGIYFAQFVGSAEDFAEGGAFETVTITCDSAAPVTVDWSSAE